MVHKYGTVAPQKMLIHKMGKKKNSKEFILPANKAE